MVVKRFFQYKETAATIIAEEIYIEEIKRGLLEAREIIEKYIIEDPFFLYTLEPYEPSPTAHPLIKRMCNAAKAVNVGPMASVAGAISQYSLEKALKKGAEHVVIDNGGDIAIRTKEREVKIGIYTGNALTRGLALLLRPEDKVGGVCTSSGNIGPSISFGNADSVTILGEDAIIADAAATAVANEIREEEDFKKALGILEDIKGVKGAIATLGRKIALWGELPQIIRARVPTSKITWRWF